MYDRSFRSKFLREIAFRAGDCLFGTDIVRRLKFLEQAQWWDRAQIEAYRDRALSKLMYTAQSEVPLYRKIFADRLLDPRSIRTPSDLRQLPVVSKSELIRGYPSRVTRVTGKRVYESSTSGSTGQNFRVLEDSETAAKYRAAFLLAVEWSGWRFGHPHLQMGMNLNRSFDRRLKDWALNCTYVSAFELDDGHLDKILDLLESRRIQHLWGYPGAVYFLARRARDRGWNRPLSGIVTWGDTVFPEFRLMIEGAFGARVYDTYGCAEGIQVSAQCGVGSGYHIHEFDTIVEFVDDHGRPVPDGAPGQLILTRLHPGPMPLIRYAVGDIGTPAVRRQCPCGRGLSLMDSVQGRISDTVVTPTGGRLIVHFFTGILEYFTEVKSFQVIQDEVDRITLLIVATGVHTADLGSRIVERLRERGAHSLTIDVEFVAEIPPTSAGKRRFVLSSLGTAEPT